MSTASQQQKISALWDQVVLNSKVVRGTLEGVEDRVSSFESKVTAALFEQLIKYYNPAEKLNSFKDGLAASKEPLESVHANLYPLCNALIGFELTERDSWLQASYELGELLIDLLPQLTDVNPDSVKELFHKIETVIDGIFDVIEVTEQFDDLSRMDLIVKLRHTINTIIDGLHIFGLNDMQLLSIKKGINPILNTLTMVALNGGQSHVANNTRSYKNNDESEVQPNETKVVPSLISDAVQKNVDRHFPEIVTELNDLPFISQKSFREKDIKEIWEYLVSALQPFDASDYSDVQTALVTLKWKTDSLLDYLCYSLLKNNSAAIQFLESTIRPNLDQWFSLPNDFRPNNWIEIMHQLVKNIQFTLNSKHSAGPIGLIKSFVQKLEALLHYLDNKDFIFLLTSKENPNIHNIQLPNILDEEEEEEPEAELLEHHSETKTAKPEYPEYDFDKESSEANAETRLTINAIIEHLFFDETKGAIAKLSPEYIDVVHDLYYREWLKSRKEKVIDDLLSLFSRKVLTDFTNEIKGMLLHENGVNIGELVDFLVDKVLGLLNRIYTVIKETISYVFDEIFSLLKAILSFLKEVDLPQEARELLKKLPPFAKMPDDTTLLHILVAIPYTLYTEFINFESKSQTV